MPLLLASPLPPLLIPRFEPVPQPQPSPVKTALHTTCRELQNLIANSRARTQQPSRISQGGALQSPIVFAPSTRSHRAKKAVKPARRNLPKTSNKQRSTHHTSEPAETQYEGIKDLFKTPLREVDPNVPRMGSLERSAFGRSAEGAVRSLDNCDGIGDLSRPERTSQKTELGKYDEAMVGMLLRQMRIGGIEERKRRRGIWKKGGIR